MDSDYEPGPWNKGGAYDYNAARAAYDPTGGRSYSSPASAASSASPVSAAIEVPDKVVTQCQSPVIIICDGTGSMGDFPKVIFSKLPLLDDGMKDYLTDPEISYAMVGDAGYDGHPLQVQPFSKGTAMVDAIAKLSIEGGGGGNQTESYDLAALYYLNNFEAPKAVIKPILIFICDEGVYPNTDKNWAGRFAKVKQERMITDTELFRQLTEKFSVYCIRKHYENGLVNDKMTGSNLRIHQQWEKLVGADRIAMLQDPARVADLILGLLAVETDKMDFFKKEIEWRQKPEQVNTVMRSMVSVKKLANKPVVNSGLSIAKRPDVSKPIKGSKSLLE